MKNNLLIAVGVVVLFIFAVFALSSYNANVEKAKAEIPAATSAPAETTGAEVSTELTPAMDFTLKDMNGNDVSLSSLKGKRVFLNFWATWCPPCKAEMPDIEKLYQETKDTDLVIVTINAGEPKETVKAFLEKNGYHFMVLLDTKGTVSNLYNVTGIPTSIFIDKDGNMATENVGMLTYKAMKNFVDALK